MKVTNPATEEDHIIEETPIQEIPNMVGRARQVQIAWSDRSLRERVGALAKLPELVEAKLDQLASCVTQDMGKPVKHSRNEVANAAAQVKFLNVVAGLQADGATVRVFDPEGMEEAKALMDDVEWCKDAYDAADGADALTIVTEWNEFRALDLKRIKSLMKSPVMVDLRNIYDPAHMAAAGFQYTCIGRRPAVPE